MRQYPFAKHHPADELDGPDPIVNLLDDMFSMSELCWETHEILLPVLR